MRRLPAHWASCKRGLGILDPKAFRAAIGDVIEIEVHLDDIAHPLNGTALDADLARHFIKRQPLNALGQGAHKVKRAIKIAHAIGHGWCGYSVWDPRESRFERRRKPTTVFDAHMRSTGRRPETPTIL